MFDANDHAAPFALHPPASEEQLDAVLAILRKRPHAGLIPLLLVGSLAAYLLLQRRESNSWREVVILVCVLTLHELGHYIAMRAFGYRDVKMFFIPLLGAAVSGRKTSVEAWKEGVVLLAGPLPGIVLGGILAATLTPAMSPWVRDLALMLLAINGFNLLPLSMLDGGKVLQITIFARHAVLELAFLLVAAVVTVGWAFTHDAKVLGYFAIMTLIQLPMRHRQLQAARQLRAEEIQLPATETELEGDSARRLYAAALATVPAQHQTRHREVVAAMRSVFELTRREIPGALPSLALIAAWVGSMGLSVLGGVLWAAGSAAWSTHALPEAGATVDLPQAPTRSEQTFASPTGAVQGTTYAALAGRKQCVISIYLQPSRYTWNLDVSVAAVHDALSAMRGLRVGAPRPVVLDGVEAREFSVVEANGVGERLIVAARDRVKVHVLATTDAGWRDASRCLSSFRWSAGPTTAAPAQAPR